MRKENKEKQTQYKGNKDVYMMENREMMKKYRKERGKTEITTEETSLRPKRISVGKSKSLNNRKKISRVKIKELQ